MTTSDKKQVIETVEQTETIISEVFNERNYYQTQDVKNSINLRETF